MLVQPTSDHSFLSFALRDFWALSATKILNIEKKFDPGKGAPVYTVGGRYTSRGWTEWTQGFQYGSALLQFEATGDEQFLEIGRQATLKRMAPHLSHFGVHDHGFNNVSTYGNLHRLMAEKIIPPNDWEQNFYELAIKLSGAAQARRWTTLPGGGFMYSFNGPHSLFVDTIRTVRILALSHALGHDLREENDRIISLLDRGIDHMLCTAKYAIYYGEGRDLYDVNGRTAHESIFNINDGRYRCPNSQQGFSGFSTWTRGLAWAMLGFAEQLEYLGTLSPSAVAHREGKEKLESILHRAAQATCDFYLQHTPWDGIPYWDTGAPGLIHLADYLLKPADPYNDYEPVDSSAAAIGAQGLCRLGHYLNAEEPGRGEIYWQAGLQLATRLLQSPYLSTAADHQGLLLHSVYHRPNGWDYIPPGRQIPCGESSMWGDYHFRELMLYLQRQLHGRPYYTFFNGLLAHD